MFSGNHGGRKIISGGSVGQLVPRPLAEQRQPDPREHARRARARRVADERRGRRMCVGVGGIAGQPQRDVGLDRRRQVGRAAVEGRPGAVGALLRADPVGAAPRRPPGVRMPRNSRSSRSSASIVTLVSSSPFHQPAGVLQAEQRVAGPGRARHATSRRAGRSDGHDWRSDHEAGQLDQLGPRAVGRGRPATERARARRRAARAATASVHRAGRRSARRVPAARAISGSVGVPFGERGRGSSRRLAHRRPRQREHDAAASSCCWRRSLQTGLPVTSGSPQMPSTSSTAWNASPSWRPNAASASTDAVAGAGQHARRSTRRRRAARRSCRPPSSTHSSSVTSSTRSRTRCRRPGRRSCAPVARVSSARGARRRRARSASSSTSQASVEQRVAGEDRRRRRRTAPTPSAGAGARGRRP